MSRFYQLCGITRIALAAASRKKVITENIISLLIEFINHPLLFLNNDKSAVKLK